jgi:type IV secretion system protein VirB10
MVESPDFLGTPARGAGVRRLNRRPLIIAGVILCLILAAISYTYQMRLAELRRRNAERQGQAEPIGAEPAILKDAPDTGLIPRREAAPRQPTPPVEPSHLRHRPHPILMPRPGSAIMSSSPNSSVPVNRPCCRLRGRRPP